MTTFFIREVRMQSGEHIPLLVSGSPLGLPVPLATRYVLTQFRPKGLKVSSIRQRLSALALAYTFFAKHGIQLDERAAKRQFLSQEELVALSDYCRRTQKNGTQRVVGPGYAALRFRVATDYIRWVSEPIISRIVDDSRRDAALGALQSFLKRAHTVAPAPGRPDASVVSGERLGFTPEQRALFLRVIEPGCCDNPFRPQLQFRNYVMFQLEFELGPRGGELLGLKTRDVDFSVEPASLTIHRRHDDPEDPRTSAPATKTLGRLLLLDAKLRDLLDEWITHHRANRQQFPAAAKHPYLFVNYRGEPLGSRGFRLIVETLRRHHPVLAGLCHHLLRHDWNDRWVELSEEEGSDPEISLRDQRYAMGWSPTSTMPFRYARRAIRNAANKKLLRMQQKGWKK
ncbi:tyrosine-type recombinase/integrase [Chromobacterium violaceum]|uniref:tyrosine-type recombinase/integrase n=1 Tax=Chromobacterium violaceum TaxID=536 RepID=UPI001B32AA93|nr:site-specific integrase [Chromobacterium violaceum]